MEMEMEMVNFLFRGASIPPATPTSFATVSVSAYHESVMVMGNYIKNSRELSQSPWIIDGVKKTETSVHELVGDLCAKAFKSTRMKAAVMVMIW